jgi:hypothetical protein
LANSAGEIHPPGGSGSVPPMPPTLAVTSVVTIRSAITMPSRFNALVCDPVGQVHLPTAREYGRNLIGNTLRPLATGQFVDALAEITGGLVEALPTPP